MGRKKKKSLKVKKILNIAAAVIIIFVTSIRISPAFAKYISTIPGLEYIVKLINYDKGIKDAVDNNFVQHVNMSEEHENLLFTIKDMIIDDSKAIIFYSIENKGNHRFVCIETMEFKDEKGEDLRASMGFEPFGNKDMNKEKRLEGVIDINFSEGTVIPDKICLNIRLKEKYFENSLSDKDRILTPIMNFRIPIDKEKFENMKRAFTLNKSIEIEGQHILFKDVIVTPTRVAVKIEYDKNNSKKILGFDDISIVDENGEVRSTIRNGIYASTIDDNNQILYFQSNYFNNPKELYITGSSMKALDKDKLTVIVDTDAKKLIKSSDDRLKLISVGNGYDVSGYGGLCIEFELEKDEVIDENHLYHIFSHSFKDSNGKVLDSDSVGSSFCDGNKQKVYYDINNNTKFKSPVYLTIEDYPTRIKGDFKVKIK